MGMKKSSQVSPGLTATYATVSFILEVGLLVAAGFTALTYLPFAPLVSALIVVIPLLLIWSLVLSPKARVRLRLRTRLVLIHLVYVAGSYALWLSIAHNGSTQYLFWPAIMLGLGVLSMLLVLVTGGRIVPHPRAERKAMSTATVGNADGANSHAGSGPSTRPRGRRAAR
ncbi:DUF2568 domain-containing protein [Glutamicibacter sp. MNS18]|uniref:DUF2568 domain-containing protein n=1 Tax=Glutamicibacter sp. MNS18 TaxID=2989817 RepID=UPI002235EA2A|nr:DUF2568 domain-containing protein [Glutamicibacter sp. MNS18]MCW4467013.1 DUF2568 domain-containing protein [Glutamicibacter sp. MNS18]